MKKNFNKLNNSIIKCIKCKRLVNFRTKISIQKRKQFINEKYWGKPITGYGDTDGKITLSMGSTVTRSLAEGRYLYDINVSSGSTFFKVIEGNVLVRTGIST